MGKKKGIAALFTGMISGFLVYFYNISDILGITISLLFYYTISLGEEYYITVNLLSLAFTLMLFVSAIYVHWRKRN